MEFGNSFDIIQHPTLNAMRECDEIIDVRSPCEYAQDHIPGAINLPVLSDEQRVEVGTNYRRGSRLDAKRIGAMYVSRNISRHLERHFTKCSKSYRPLVYCWRGGMRSNALATILAAIGWHGAILAGGYKTWRRHVVDSLRATHIRFPFILLDGQTGTGKTNLLHLLAEKGCPTLDLEHLAQHRGSVFGGFDDSIQPPQKLFESKLWEQLSNCQPTNPIVVEAESPKIGRCALPQSVVQSMRRSPRFEIRADLKTRAQNLVVSYPDLVSSPEKLSCAIKHLQPFHSKSRIQEWLELAKTNDFETLAYELIQHHYDPRYEKQREKRNNVAVEVIELKEFSVSALDRAADHIIDSIYSNYAAA